jgi:hypothetical protein
MAEMTHLDSSLDSSQIQLFNQETEVYDDNFEDDSIEDEEEIIEPFDPTKIRVKTKPMTIDLILKRIKYDEIDLAPNFQRHAGIWTNKAKSRLIESILIRIPLPAFYIDATNDDKWLVIDGLQRISTLKSFIIDKKLKLTGLEFLRDLDKKKYDDLPRNYQRRIDETELTVYLIEQGTPPEVKYNIFRRINTGGLPLAPQELRQAINPGKSIEILKKLANSQEFEKVTNLSKKRKERMDDREFVLGFIAFTLTSYENYPVKKGRDYFLHETMKKLNKIEDSLEIEIESKFIRAMQAADNIFGEDAFRKITENQTKKSPVNKALFEGWSVTLSNLNDKELEILINKKEILKEKFLQKMKDDSNFIKSVSQAASKVQYRFSEIEKIVQQVL